jgi:hypothetical protein
LTVAFATSANSSLYAWEFFHRLRANEPRAVSSGGSSNDLDRKIVVDDLFFGLSLEGRVSGQLQLTEQQLDD